MCLYHHLCCIRTFSDSLAFGGNYFWKQHIDYYDSEYHAWICVEKSKNYGEALEKFNAVQQSLLSGAENVKVCLYRSNAKRIIENKNNEIEKEEKRLRNCQVSVYGLAGGMQILKRFLILAVGVYLIYRNIIKVGGLLVAVQLAEVLAAPAETLAYLLNAKMKQDHL